MEKGATAPITWLVILAVGVWWLANTIATISSKSVLREVVEKNNEAWTSAFKDLRWVDLTAFQHFLGAAVSVIALKVMKKSIWPENAEGLRITIIIAAIGNVIGNLATNAAYALTSSSTAQVVKACEPIFTFGLTALFYKDYSPLDLSIFLSVVIVVFGVIEFVIGDMAFNIWSILAAMISNTAFPTRNIFLKKFRTLWDSPLQKFAVMSIYSFTLLLPALFIKMLVDHGVSVTRRYESLISSVFYSTYNLASITVLESVSPVTHAILNLCRRLLVILVNIAYFHTAFSLSMLLSLLVFLVGCFFYRMKSDSTRSLTMKVLVLVFTFVFYLMGPQVTHRSQTNRVFTPTSHPLFDDHMMSLNDNISMAWVYNKPVPDTVIRNIEHISHKFPNVTLCMYCGTTQCVRAVSEVNVDVKFLVVSHLLRDTPLEHWLAHHPINKVFAEKKFEENLQEVVRLGILWKFGGFYIDPTVSISDATTLSNTEAWVSSGVRNSDNPDFLEVSYFPRYHPFIRELMDLYYTQYPTKRSRNSPFRFNFRETVRQQMAKGDCRSCPMQSTTLLLERVISVTDLPEANHYGTLYYDTRVHHIGIANLGDEVQGFPGLQFLPFVDNFVERDNIRGFRSTNNVTVFFNAWWGDGNWPPTSNNLHPILTSVHIHNTIQKLWAQHIGYLKSREPIGCRDSATLDFCKKHNVKAYFSGCLILMLKNPNIDGKQTDEIYMVDVSSNYAELFPPEVKSKAMYVEHNLKNNKHDGFARFTAAYNLMKKYGRAKLVITQRIHSALPAVAMGTPVIFLDADSMPGGGGGRTAGLTPLFHSFNLKGISSDEIRNLLASFPWHDIPPNPNTGMMMRMRATFWNVIRKNQALKEAGMKFGMIPMTPPPTAPSPRKMIFHLIFTTSNTTKIQLFTKGKTQLGFFNWRHRRCLESILHHHPTAQVIIHSNTLVQEQFDVFTESGYSVTVKKYNLDELLKDSPAQGFLSKLKRAKTGGYWYSHESDLIRLLVLYKWGGVYMDTDMILVRSLDTLVMNSLGWQDSNKGSLNGAFMMFEKGNPYIRACLKHFAAHYKRDKWAENGPGLLTHVFHQYKTSGNVHDHPYTAFYMMHWGHVDKQCFGDTSGKVFDTNMKVLKTTAYAVHLNSKITGHRGMGSDVLKNGTICSYLLNEFCVLCDEMF